MHEVVVIEDGCCHAGQMDEVVDFLASRLEGHATVAKYQVGGELGFSQVPPELTNRLLAQGANAVPVVAIDGDLLFNGDMPEDREEALRAIEQKLSAAVTGQRA